MSSGEYPNVVSASARWGNGVGCDAVPNDMGGMNISPPECAHMSPPCPDCSRAGKVWSQFDPERGSSRRAP